VDRNGQKWTRAVEKPVHAGHLKRVAGGGLAFIRGWDIGMFRAYWMGLKYEIGHIIERFETNLRVTCRKAGGFFENWLR
jgi:hypothetical protein